MSVSTLATAMLLASAPATSQDIATPPAAMASPALETSTMQPSALATPAAGVGALPAESTPAAASPLAPPADDAGADDGAIVVTARRRRIAADPLAGINEASFKTIEFVDKTVVGPTASTYKKAVPKPVRNGLRNVLINLAEPIVSINYLLQFKPGKAAETVGRFALNSTIGVAGLFDMAKRHPFNLPYRQNGFANTFGYHGIGNGPFLFVPILGPTTLRDLVGRVLDLSLIPAVVGSPFNDPLYGLTTGIVKSMNDRVDFDGQIKKARASGDPYAASRDFYLKRRAAEIAALHSPEYRRRKGIADPVLPPIVPTQDGKQTETSIPSSTGMAPAAPAPAAPISGTPALSPAP